MGRHGLVQGFFPKNIPYRGGPPLLPGTSWPRSMLSGVQRIITWIPKERGYCLRPLQQSLCSWLRWLQLQALMLYLDTEGIGAADGEVLAAFIPASRAEYVKGEEATVSAFLEDDEAQSGMMALTLKG